MGSKAESTNGINKLLPKTLRFCDEAVFPNGSQPRRTPRTNERTMTNATIRTKRSDFVKYDTGPTASATAEWPKMAPAIANTQKAPPVRVGATMNGGRGQYTASKRKPPISI